MITTTDGVHIERVNDDESWGIRITVDGRTVTLAATDVHRVQGTRDQTGTVYTPLLSERAEPPECLACTRYADDSDLLCSECRGGDA